MIDFNTFIKSLGLTQIEVAQKLGVAQSVISRINTGREEISAALKAKMLMEFGAKAEKYFEDLDKFEDPEVEYGHINLTILRDQLHIKDAQIQDQADIIKSLLNILQNRTLTN